MYREGHTPLPKTRALAQPMGLIQTRDLCVWCVHVCTRETGGGGWQRCISRRPPVHRL